MQNRLQVIPLLKMHLPDGPLMPSQIPPRCIRIMLWPTDGSQKKS